MVSYGTKQNITGIFNNESLLDNFKLYFNEPDRITLLIPNN